MECLLKNMSQIQCAKVPTPLSGNQGFFDTLTWGSSSPEKAVSPIPVKVLRTKERDDIRPQITKYY